MGSIESGEGEALKILRWRWQTAHYGWFWVAQIPTLTDGRDCF